MNLIKLAIERPIAVMAAVLMIIMFGLVALETIPIQLTPDVRKPMISVRTNWTGAAPAEIEREIVNRQEEVLRGLEGLDEMSSRSRDGRGSIKLEFSVAQDMDKALLLVANRLDRVGDYPAEADQPTLDTAGSEDRPIAWFTLTRTGDNSRDITTYGDYIEDVIQDRLERVPGVALVNVYGGTKRQMEVVVDPAKMARYSLTVPQVVNALSSANSSVSAGDIEEGKRRYVVRTEGELSSIAQVEAVVVRSIGNLQSGNVARVTIGDIAEVGFGYKKSSATIRREGRPAIAMNTVRETGANVIDTMDGIRAAVKELNEVSLPGEQLILDQVYDETVYINSAIDLVQQNIYIGGTLAALILFLFLRSGSATLIVSLAIPVSVVGSFVAMAAMGRSINVISLAGIAFAVGMVVDAAIVVLENIYRLRQEGKPVATAAYMGAQQVWGAVLVSALTTVLVFTPILIMKLEIGQLFRDIAVAISVAVTLSLVVAITLIPALSNRLLKKDPSENTARRLPIIDDIASWFVRGVVGFTHAVVKSKTLSVAIIIFLSGSAIAFSVLFLPKLEYLPEGNRNLIIGVLLPPPGYNLATATSIAQDVEAAVRPLWAKETGPESEPGQPPKIKNFFFVARSSTTFVGASSVDPTRASELIPVLREPVFKEPGTFGFITQPSLFGRAIGSGRSIDVDISGPDLEQVLDIALRGTGMISKLLPREEGNQLRPKPGLELGAPEVRVYPDPIRMADNGVTAREFSQTVDTFNDDLRVTEITVDGKRIDLALKGPQSRITETQGIENLPIVTRAGKIIPVSSLADVRVTSGPTEILHKERERTVTLEVRPAPNIPLEAAIDILNEKVIGPLRKAGLPPGVHIQLSGTADKLTEAWDHMVMNLIIAVLIVYLVMAVLFESFIYPLIIILSVPLATAGGVGGLAILNQFSPHQLDMLTLLGFVILVGIVVNNAILLVHQTLYHHRQEGLDFEDSLIAATRNRIRPIFMSTLTSVFGMLPLVVFPGAGSELYSGLGSVVVGGLALSALLTLAIIPPLMSLVSGFAERSHDKRAEPVSAE
jgi:hydrophobic/amphiphilic exporter-1 (mainly G- bacteria), HAE1 family